MAGPHFERLSALDAAMVFLETPAAHMHIGIVCVCEAGPLARPRGGIDIERIRTHIAAALDELPRHRQRLAFIPLEQHPVWVDDRSFRLSYHVHHVSLPHPGDERQLKRLVGRILSQKLDLTKPPWEIWVVEGLSGGRFALVKKIHHCMVDGAAAVHVMSSILSPSARAPRRSRRRWRPRPAPDALELGVTELLRWSHLPGALTRSLRAALEQPAGALGTLRQAAVGALEALESRLHPAPRTPLSPGRIGPHRRVDWLRVDFARLAAIKQRAGVTLNDVLIALAAGAARRHLRAHGVAVRGLDFRAVVPFTTRRTLPGGRDGNRIVPALLRLPVDGRGPLERLRRVAAATAELKRSGQIRAVELFEEAANWADAALLSALARRLTRWWAGNMIVTNVAGPPAPLYLCGARVLECYPSVPLLSNQALSLALVSYAGGLYFGFNADHDALPDLHAFVAGVETEIGALERSLSRRQHPAPARRSGRRPA